MAKKLFLLDGMALVYRAHFALVARPIFTSKGVNTSALYGFTQTLLEILRNQQPTHIAVAFDTDAPTKRHAEFAEYKAQREAMPEDIAQALPHVRRLLDAFRIRVLTCDGFEADDIIGTLARRAAAEGFATYMVTPDKDFGQLITENTFLYKPSRMGDAVEILGLTEIRKRWGIQRAEQVIDVLALMGDASDNIPGVPGIGEKTATKLIGQYGSVQNVLDHAGELTPKTRQTLETNREVALLSKRLATINCETPCPFELDRLNLQPPNEEQLKNLLVEFEFNSIGRRLFGEEFKAGRGAPPTAASQPRSPAAENTNPKEEANELVLEGEATVGEDIKAEAPTVPETSLKTIADISHRYVVVNSVEERGALVEELSARRAFCLQVMTIGSSAKEVRLMGLAFSFESHTAHYLPLPVEPLQATHALDALRPVLQSEKIEKVGYDLKFALNVLKWRGVTVRGKLFDVMVAHSLIEPDMRHALNYLAEVYLRYARPPLDQALGALGAQGRGALLAEAPLEKLADCGNESADLAWQLHLALEPLLKEKGQERVFYQVEAPLIPVLADMEYEGIKVDAGALAEFANQLAKEIDHLERTICQLAGSTFNLNSPRQLGQVLFDVLKLCDAPKKTRTGQYATDEQTLAALAPDHEIVRLLLEYRNASKLKSTYADVLPTAIWPRTGRVHTTFNQVMTSTGRLNSQDPNLQNIPIRTERGQEIRKAFVSGNDEYLLLSADYSQIELRIIAELSHERGLLEAFDSGVDVHTATAAKVYGVGLKSVTAEMRRKAKMVNYGIAYGISAFGLAQRLGIARREALEIINQYFRQFPGIRQYMDQTIASARQRGYVETITGRRRYIRDINSSNSTLRGAAERNAINAPVQGSAADLIKVAMIDIHRELEARNLKTRILLQVHDELVFDLYRPEEQEVREMVEEKMKNALSLGVPIMVEMGVGRNWLEAH
jgi:DNA polymerase-1